MAEAPNPCRPFEAVQAFPLPSDAVFIALPASTDAPFFALRFPPDGEPPLIVFIKTSLLDAFDPVCLVFLMEKLAPVLFFFFPWSGGAP